ncbi:hypothetical protein Taro_029710 [Colocasia esculenta]|uniref:Uncharacterized protein n=1 Tax=Colocasia esculenta TaxID=4460 RepID=A0A843VRY9_COLES|nr:hypothetical protein [Colocasia esculenta]
MGSVPANEVFASSHDDGTQGEEHDNPLGNDPRDGETASSSESDDDQQPPVSEARQKGKEVVSEVPLLADSPFESQASTSKEISQIRNAMKWFNKEMGSMKSMLAEILKAVGAQAPPPPAPPADQNLDADTSRPSGLSVPVSGPSGPAPAAAAEAEVNEQEPSGPAKHVEGPPGPAEKVSGPSGPLESDHVQTVVEEEVLAPKPPAPSFSSQTPVPPSPPSASTAPPAPQTFKKPQPRPISSPTPFPSQSTFSPVSSTHIPPPPSILEVPPASSSAGASSSGPSSLAGPSPHTSSSPSSLLHPHPPPSFITIIPEGTQIDGPYMSPIKDKFEDTILGSVLKVGQHIHVSDPSYPPSKKRKTSSSFNPLYPPLWFSLTEVTKNRPLYREYLTKVVFAILFNLPFLNLSDHLQTILPYTSLTKIVKAKIFSSAQSLSEEEWARSNKVLCNKFLSARCEVFPPRDHSLTLSEWFLLHHNNSWAPFIQKEIKMIRQFNMFNDYRYLHRLLEVQLSQFRQAIRNLGPELGTAAIQVDFATLQLPKATYLPPLHSLLMDTPVGSVIFDRFVRVMGRIKVQKGSVVAFPRFIFREYHLGHIHAKILAPALSECERLTPAGWAKFYPLSAQQLSYTNVTLAREGRPPISAATFLDMNSLHLVNDPLQIWVEMYKVYVAMRQELKHRQIFYLEDLVGSRVMFPSVVKEDLVGSRVLFPSVVKEDLVRQIATGSYKDHDGSFGQAARTRQGSLLRSDHDRYLCRDDPENAACQVQPALWPCGNPRSAGTYGGPQASALVRHKEYVAERASIAEEDNLNYSMEICNSRSPSSTFSPLPPHHLHLLPSPLLSSADGSLWRDRGAHGGVESDVKMADLGIRPREVCVGKRHYFEVLLGVFDALRLCLFGAGSPWGAAYGRISYWKLKNLTSKVVDVKLFRRNLKAGFLAINMRLTVGPSTGLRLDEWNLAILLVSLGVECDSIQCVPIVVVTIWFSWGPFFTSLTNSYEEFGITLPVPALSSNPSELRLVGDGSEFRSIMALRLRHVEKVAEQVPQQEARDAPPPQQVQPGLQV